MAVALALKKYAFVEHLFWRVSKLRSTFPHSMRVSSLEGVRNGDAHLRSTIDFI